VKEPQASITGYRYHLEPSEVQKNIGAAACTEVPYLEKKEKGEKKRFEIIIAKNFPYLMKKQSTNQRSSIIFK
jgi:hypothetical protein